jgi:hypothetical protein
MAALCGARLTTYLQDKLKVNRAFLWPDSQIVLHWLQSIKRLKPFVANRIQEIKEITSIAIALHLTTLQTCSLEESR